MADDLSLRTDPSRPAGKNYKEGRSIFAYYPRLHRVYVYVQLNYSRKILVTEAAKIAGLEKKYFSRYFMTKTGTRFVEWLTNFRVVRAKEMMMEKNYTIVEIAFAVGFRDIRTFERAFKRRTGMTPKQFKNSVRPS